MQSNVPSLSMLARARQVDIEGQCGQVFDRAGFGLE
jgi:hypothetical protein